MCCYVESPKEKSSAKQKETMLMDQLLNEESQTDIEKKPRRRKKNQIAQISIPIPAFLTHIGEDVRWYYDVRLWSPLILLLLILALLPGKQQKVEPTEPVPETAAVVETQPDTVTVAPTEPVNPEAEALAKLAESVGAGRSDNVKTIIMWVAVNRSEDRSNGYGQSLADEIARPNQWQGYDETILYTEETYALAKSVLDIKQNNGLRPLDSDMLWFVLNDNGSITVRNRFTAGANQKWVEKTIK